jgi:hypothetical protein
MGGRDVRFIVGARRAQTLLGWPREPLTIF